MSLLDIRLHELRQAITRDDENRKNSWRTLAHHSSR